MKSLKIRLNQDQKFLASKYMNTEYNVAQVIFRFKNYTRSYRRNLARKLNVPWKKYQDLERMVMLSMKGENKK